MYLVPSESKNKKYFLLTSSKPLTKIAGSVTQWYGFADPDMYQNVLDPQHWCSVVQIVVRQPAVRLARPGLNPRPAILYSGLRIRIT
jgi:hypothetical protein